MVTLNLHYRYAYLEESGEDMDEEGIALTSGAMKISGEVVERKERKTASTTDLVAYGEDVEEDKRE